MDRGRPDVHPLHVFFALLNVSFGNLISRNAFFIGFFDDLVIHVRKIRYKIHFISFMLQIAAHRVKYNHRTGIADVDEIIYGRTADVHADLPFLNGHKFFFLFG